MEAKKHVKLYKSGKLWVAALITTATLSAGMLMQTGSVSADTNNSAINTSLAESAADTGNQGNQSNTQ